MPHRLLIAQLQPELFHEIVDEIAASQGAAATAAAKSSGGSSIVDITSSDSDSNGLRRTNGSDVFLPGTSPKLIFAIVACGFSVAVVNAVIAVLSIVMFENPAMTFRLSFAGTNLIFILCAVLAASPKRHRKHFCENAFVMFVFFAGFLVGAWFAVFGVDQLQQQQQKSGNSNDVLHNDEILAHAAAVGCALLAQVSAAWVYLASVMERLR